MIPLWYRLLLRLYPREFRDRFGAELLATAAALDTGPRRKRWTALRDAITSAIIVRSDIRRDRRGATDPLWLDIRLAARGLWREPKFTAVVVTTMAVAIGANAALLGLADRLIFRGPEQIRDAGQVMRVYLQAQPPGRPTVNTPNMGHVLFDAIRDAAPLGVTTASYALSDGTMGRSGDARSVSLGYASPELFEVLGTAPELGRLFGARAEDLDPTHAPAVLSYDIWQHDFAGDHGMLGRTVEINDVAHTVIGVTPRGFTGTELAPVDAWLPIGVLNRRVTPQWETAWNAQWLNTVVRLPDGVDRAGVDVGLTAVLRSRYTGPSPVMKTAQLYVAPLTASESGSESTDARVVRWLSAVSLLVFIVACANIMSLLLTRGEARRREVGVRMALGASRSAVVRKSLIEAGLLAALGAAAGVAVAFVLGEAARRTLFESVAWTSSPINLRIIGWASLIAVIATMVTGLVPALGSSRVDLVSSLRGTTRGNGSRRSRLRTGLAIAQATVCVVLLVGAGLFVRSLWKASTLDLGVDAHRVAVIETSRGGLGEFPEGPLRDAERTRRKAFLQASLAVVRALPGVDAASVAIGMPFGYQFKVPMASPGLDIPDTNVNAVTADYFATVGTRVIDGRAFSSADRKGSAPVAIVSAQMAAQVWPGRSPIGSCLIVGGPVGPCATIIGVAANTFRERLRETPTSQVYIPAGQESGFGGDVLLVRAEQGLSTVSELVRRRVAELDPSVTLVRAQSLQSRIDPQLRSWKLGSAVFAFAGILALIVASAGIYSVLSYAVAAQRHEIGVRLALGATVSDVGRVVVRSSLLMTMIGIALGGGIALSVSHLLEPLLFDVSPRDPLVFVTVATVLLLVAVMASVAPAVRASRINPLDVLRGD